MAHSLFHHRGWFHGDNGAVQLLSPLSQGGKAQQQLDAAGSLPIAYSGVAKGNLLYAFGYLAAAPYNGTDLVYCSGEVGQDLFNANATWSMVCNMTGGASGVLG